MKILIAPDKFKDALDAPGVCTALAEGWCAGAPDAEIDCCPLGDGGEGTGAILAGALDARECLAKVRDPLGRECAARWWWQEDRRLAIVEMAEASGVARLAPHERKATQTTTFGTGELVRAAVEREAQRILLAVGGSATVDGGVGCLQALGWRFSDNGGRELPVFASGAVLRRIAAIQPPPVGLSAELEILTDVDNPLCGPRGAAEVFGPQKGATAGEVAELASGLEGWAGLVEQRLGRRVRDAAGMGASGGLPFGLMLAGKVRLTSGFERVAELVALNERLRGVDWCLTGEGRLDAQTAGGKVVAGVGRRGAANGVRTVAFVGSASATKGRPLDELAQALRLYAIVPISPPGLSLEQALVETAQRLRAAAGDYVSQILKGGPAKN